MEQVNVSTHNGTHLDAPCHLHPTMNRGGVLLVFGAPCQLRSLAGQEHGPLV